MNGMLKMLKWPLIIAAIVVVVRVLLEQAGAPGNITNLFSVVILYVIICPVYFAIKIANGAVARPYLTLIKTTVLYTILARAMVIPTYWLAYIYQWPAPRFGVAQGGVVGPGVTPLWGFVVIPLGAMLVWIVAAIVIGGGIGSIIIALKRRSANAAAGQFTARS